MNLHIRWVCVRARAIVRTKNTVLCDRTNQWTNTIFTHTQYIYDRHQNAKRTIIIYDYFLFMSTRKNTFFVLKQMNAHIFYDCIAHTHTHTIWGRHIKIIMKCMPIQSIDRYRMVYKQVEKSKVRTMKSTQFDITHRNACMRTFIHRQDLRFPFERAPEWQMTQKWKSDI